MGACGSSSFDLEAAVVIDPRSGEVPVAAPLRAGLYAEPRSISHRPCDCCDGEVASVRGIVTEDGRIAGVYFATFTVGHAAVVRVALGLSNLDGPQPSVLLDLSRVDGELVVAHVAEDDAEEDAAAFARFAEAIAKTDDLVSRYLAGPRPSFIREIR